MPANRRTGLRNTKLEILRGHDAVLDEFVGLGEHVVHVLDVPVADVRGEHGVQLAAARQQAGIEGDRVHPVVGLAAVVEVGHAAIEEIVHAADAGGGEIVERVGSDGRAQDFGSNLPASTSLP